MTALVLIFGVLGATVVAISRALLADEARGRIHRHAAASVEATIASLPPGLQEEWADEWRADLDEYRSMPLTALVFARNLRVAVRQLVDEPVPAPAEVAAPGSRSRPLRWGHRSTRLGSHGAGLRQALRRHGEDTEALAWMALVLGSFGAVISLASVTPTGAGAAGVLLFAFGVAVLRWRHRS
jgi:hypothetical protein